LLTEWARNGVQVNKGFVKFILWGDDLGAYGFDASCNIGTLLDEICRKYHTANIKLFLHRVNLQWLKKYKVTLSKAFDSGMIKMIYSPVQSGSNRILELMARSYSREDIISTFGAIKKMKAGVVIKTDIMVGFPSESEDDFSQTIDLLRSDVIDDVQVFAFGAIKNTPAYLMENQICDDIKKYRSNVIWNCFPHLRFYLQADRGKYSLIDRGNVDEKGFCWTLSNINPDYYE
jgi:tRNA-2-methylthio-N6-dimethylallyladenosine synthase